MNAKTLPIVFLAAALAGCGYYSLAGSIPPHIHSIAIPLVENQTAEFALAEAVTDNLQMRFMEENILRLADEDQADSILRGTITRVDDSAQTFTGNEQVTEYRFRLEMDLEWYDVREDQVLLKKRYSGESAYGVGGDIGTDGIDNDGDTFIDADDEDEFGEPREYSTKIAVKKIAEEVINDIMSTW